MISLKKSLSDLDRQEGALRAALECFQSAVRMMSDYAVDVSPDVTLEYRDQLDLILSGLRGASEPPALFASRDALAREVKHFQDESTLRLARLRDDFSAAARALSDLVTSIASSNDDHEAILQQQVSGLESLAALADPARIRDGLRIAIQTMNVSIKQIRAENRMVVAQLHDEIRMLQVRVQEAERGSGVSETVDFSLEAPAAGPEQIIEQYIDSATPFCMLFVFLRNAALLRQQISRDAVGQSIANFCAHLESVVPSVLAVTTWGEDVVCVLTGADMASSIQYSRKLTSLLSRYPIQIPGPRYGPVLQGGVAVIDSRPQDTVASLQHRTGTVLEQLKSKR